MGLVLLSRLYQGPLIIETDNKMIANEWDKSDQTDRNVSGLSVR